MKNHPYEGRQIITLRVGDDHLRALQKLCRHQRIDRSTALRQLIERLDQPDQSARVPAISFCGGVMACDAELATGSPT